MRNLSDAAQLATPLGAIKIAQKLYKNRDEIANNFTNVLGRNSPIEGLNTGIGSRLDKVAQTAKSVAAKISPVKDLQNAPDRLMNMATNAVAQTGVVASTKPLLQKLGSREATSNLQTSSKPNVPPSMEETAKDMSSTQNDSEVVATSLSGTDVPASMDKTDKDQLSTQDVSPDDDNPIDMMKNDYARLIKDLQDVLANTSMNPDEKSSKVESLKSQLEEVRSEAEDLENGLDSAAQNEQKGGKEKSPEEQEKEMRDKEEKVEKGKKERDGNEKQELDSIQKEATLQIAKADVKLIYDYVTKKNEPRALKAIYNYQKGREVQQDVLSQHLKKVNEIIDEIDKEKIMSGNKKRGDIKKKAENVRKEIALAQVKLYSVNVDAALRRIEDEEGDVNFFPDELKSEMTEKQKRITTAILVVFSMVKYAFKQFAKAPTIVTVFTLLSLAVIFISALLALYYCAMIINDYTNNKLINNPTNSESLDFLVANFGNSPPRKVNANTNSKADSRSKKEIGLVSNPILLFFINFFKKGVSPLFSNMLSAKYKYALFVILPWISVSFALLAIIFMIRRRNQLELTPGLVQAFLYAGMVQSGIALIANHMIFFYAYYILKGTSARIDNYNKHVLANLIQRADFLAFLQKLPTNTIGIATVTGDALSTLFRGGRTPSPSELSKAIFTLNLYEHYQQLGYRNPVLFEALDTFRIYSFILSQQSFSPALYLRRRATLIRDNGEKYRAKIESIYKSAGRPINNALIDSAIIRSSQMTAEANNMANAFFPEDAMSRFLRMAVMIAVVQFLPFTIFIYLFRMKDLRNGFIDAIRIIMGQKKKAADADIRDQEEQVYELREMMKEDMKAPKPVPPKEEKAPAIPLPPLVVPPPQTAQEPRKEKKASFFSRLLPNNKPKQQGEFPMRSDAYKVQEPGVQQGQPVPTL